MIPARYANDLLKPALLDAAAAELSVETFDVTSPPFGFQAEAIADSANSRAHVHVHAPGGGQTKDGLRVASLGQEGQHGNPGFLDMRTLRIETPALRQIKEAAGR